VLAFNSEVTDFASKLKATGPYAYKEAWQKSYELLFAFNVDLKNMEQKAKYLNEMQDLFDLTVSNYKEISKARREIEFLKACWDMSVWLS
jgi:hypothetical protein